MGGEFEAALLTYIDRITQHGADRVAVEIIDKGTHLDPEVRDLAWKCIGLGVSEGLRDLLELPGVVDQDAFVLAVLDAAS